MARIFQNKFRIRAIQSEQRASCVTDPDAKAEWIDIAIEWHALANRANEQSGENPDVEII